MEIRVRTQCGGWLYALRPRHGNVSRDRGGTPTTLCPHDPRQGRSASASATALFYPRSARTGRPPRLCVEKPVHSRSSARIVRKDELAPGGRRDSSTGGKQGTSNRHWRAHARDLALGHAQGILMRRRTVTVNDKMQKG